MTTARRHRLNETVAAGARPSTELGVLSALDARLDADDLPRGYTQRAAGPGLVRVHTRSGEIAGHVRIVPGPDGARYRAEVWRAASRRFFAFGEFWSARDAVDALPRR